MFGASGRTGRVILATASERGHEVVVFCRTPFEPEATGVIVQTGSPLDADAVRRAVAGTEAVICAFGARPPYTDVFCADATATIIGAMRSLGVVRLICVTGAMIGDYDTNRTAPFRWMTRTFQRRSPALAADRVEQERHVIESDLRWTVVKPPRLTDRPSRGRYHTGERLTVVLMSSVSRFDLAAFLVNLAETDSCVGQIVFIRCSRRGAVVTEKESSK